MSSWFADAWRSALEQDLFPDALHLKAGRTLGRRLVGSSDYELELEPGSVTLRLNQPRDTAVCTVSFPKIEDKAWAVFVDEVAQRPQMAAAVLTGSFPATLEDAAAIAGIELIPGGAFPLCSCEEWEEPCRHGVAVLVLLAEVIESDPFTLLILARRSREQLVDGVQQARSRVFGVEPATADNTPRGGDSGTDAEAAFSRASASLNPQTLPRPQPLPRRAGQPIELRTRPPSDSGIASADLTRLVADAADRATQMLLGDGTSGLALSLPADIVRMAAATPDRSAELSARAGIDRAALDAQVVAWNLGGEAGLRIHGLRWEPPTGSMASAAAALGPRARTTANVVSAPGVQLRIDPDELWWRFEPHESLGWVLASPGFVDPEDAVSDGATTLPT